MTELCLVQCMKNWASVLFLCESLQTIQTNLFHVCIEGELVSHLASVLCFTSYRHQIWGGIHRRVSGTTVRLESGNNGFMWQWKYSAIIFAEKYCKLGWIWVGVAMLNCWLFICGHQFRTLDIIGSVKVWMIWKVSEPEKVAIIISKYCLLSTQLCFVGV